MLPTLRQLQYLKLLAEHGGFGRVNTYFFFQVSKYYIVNASSFGFARAAKTRIHPRQ